MTSSNCSWEFLHIYNIDAVGDKNELIIRFWDQKVKGHGHSLTTYGQTSTLGGIFSPFSTFVMGRISVKHGYSLPLPGSAH